MNNIYTIGISAKAFKKYISLSDISDKKAHKAQ